MRIAFFVNDFDREFAGFATTVLAHQAAMRGHEVIYLTPGDFVVRPDDSLCVHGDRANAAMFAERLHQALTSAGVRIAAATRPT